MAISVPMHTKGDDLGERLQRDRTARDRDQIDLTRRQQDRRLGADHRPLGPELRPRRPDASPTASPPWWPTSSWPTCPGSPTTRWIGDVEVVDFISYAVLVQPIGLNVTVYSYDGRMSIGVLTAPEVIDDPQPDAPTDSAMRSNSSRPPSRLSSSRGSRG